MRYHWIEDNVERSKELLKLLQLEELKGKRILDVGSSASPFLTILNREGIECEYHCIDANEHALKKAREKGANALKFDLENLPLPYSKKFFDVIITTEIYEHLKNPEILLKECYRLLKDNGFVLSSVPNESCWYIRLKFLMGSPIDNEGLEYAFTHLHHPNVNQIYDFFSSVFKIEKSDRWYDYVLESPINRHTLLPQLFIHIYSRIWNLLIPSWLKKRLAYRFPNLFARTVHLRLRKK